MSVLGRQAVSVVVIVLLSKKIAPEIFGLFAMVAVVVQLLNVVKDLGLNTAIIQKPNLTKDDVSTVFWSNFIISISLAILLFSSAGAIANFYGRQELILVCRVLSIPFLLNGIGSTFLAVATKELRFKTIALVEFISVLLAGGLALLYSLYEASVWVLVLKNIIQVLLSNLLITVFTKLDIGLVFSRESLKALLGFSLFYSATRVYSHFATKSDEVFLGKFSTDTALGLYSNAYKIILLPLSLVKGQVVKVLFPTLSGIQDDVSRVQSSIISITAILSFLGFAGIFLLLCISEDLVGILLPSQWQGMEVYVKYLGIFFLFEVSIFPGAILLSQGKASIYFWLMISSKTTSMVFMGVGAYYFDAIGLLYGLILAGFLFFFVHVYVSSNAIGLKVMDLLREKVQPFILSLLCFLAVDYLAVHYMANIELIVALLIKLLAFGSSYLGCSWLLKTRGLLDLKKAFKTYN